MQRCWQYDLQSRFSKVVYTYRSNSDVSSDNATLGYRFDRIVSRMKQHESVYGIKHNAEVWMANLCENRTSHEDVDIDVDGSDNGQQGTDTLHQLHRLARAQWEPHFRLLDDVQNTAIDVLKLWIHHTPSLRQSRRGPNIHSEGSHSVILHNEHAIKAFWDYRPSPLQMILSITSNIQKMTSKQTIITTTHA